MPGQRRATQMNNYKSWSTFVFQGKKFLALEENSKAYTRIYGENFANYGSYYTIDSFKKLYKKDGETLNLNVIP